MLAVMALQGVPNFAPCSGRMRIATFGHCNNTLRTLANHSSQHLTVTDIRLIVFRNVCLVTSANMAYSYDVFQIVFFVLLLALGSELVLYLWCYQSPSFRTIDQAINKQSRKSDGSKGSSGYGVKQNKSKKSERVEGSLKKAATRELAVMKVKQSLVVSAKQAVSRNEIADQLFTTTFLPCRPALAHSACT